MKYSDSKSLSNRYGRYVQSRPSLICLLGIVLFICLIISTRKKENCWLDDYRARLFCFVLTNESNLETRARAAYETWGHRCGRFVLITRLGSSRSYTIFDNENKHLENDQLPIQYIPTLPEENYQNLPEKVRQTLLFCSEHYPDYDWYLKADDDTFIIVENLLRFLISTINRRRSKSLLYGYRFREDYYVSGGGGYVLTRQGIELFASHMKNNFNYSRCRSTMEDMMVGLCLKNILQSNEQTKDLTVAGQTIDQNGRERFHPLAFRLHFNGPGDKTKREWIHFRPFHHNLFGYDGISETTISFHYTSPEDMYQMDSFLYEIRQFDRQVCSKQK